MNWLDALLFGLIVVSMLIGLWRGLVKEVLTLVSWVLAAYLAITFSSSLAPMMSFTKVESIQSFSAFVLIFTLSVFVGAVINYLVGKLVRSTLLSGGDRVMGLFFGLLRGVVFNMILVLLIGGLTSLPSTKWWQGGVLLPGFESMAIWLKEQLPKGIGDNFDFSKEEIEPSE